MDYTFSKGDIGGMDIDNLTMQQLHVLRLLMHHAEAGLDYAGDAWVAAGDPESDYVKQFRGMANETMTLRNRLQEAINEAL